MGGEGGAKGWYPCTHVKLLPPPAGGSRPARPAEPEEYGRPGPAKSALALLQRLHGSLEVL